MENNDKGLSSNNNVFYLEVVSPEGIIYKGDANQVTVPAHDGEITIFPNHMPILSRLKDGEVIIKSGKEEMIIAITGGFLEIKNNQAFISSDYAIKAKDIEIAKAEQAKKRAYDILEEKRENVDFTIIEKELQRSILELKVAEKLKKKLRNIQ